MFIKCNAKYRKEEVTDIEFDAMTEQQQAECSGWYRFRFDPTTIVCYNECDNGKHTRMYVRYLEAEQHIIDIPIEKLDKILEDLNIKFSNITNN